jgi:lipopolysaccharide transport system permease protein
MMAAYGVAPTLAILWLPVVIGVTVLLAVSIAYPASLVGLWYGDLRTFVVSAVRTLFFVAPGLVALDQVPAGAQEWLKLNPLTGIFEAYRSVLLYGHRPAAWQLLYPTVFAVGLLGLVVPLYRREQRQFAKLVEG